MIKPRSIFIKYAGDESRVASAAGKIIGQALRREALDVGPVYRCRILDVEFALFGDHGLEDDAGIAFSKYAYQLKLTAFEAGLQTSAFAALYESMSLFLAERLCNILVCETLVVENLQRKVTEFRP